MAISYNQIPSDVLVPGIYVETDSSQAQSGPALQPYRVLLVGYRTTGEGSVLERTLRRLFHKNDARDFFGSGSMIHNMAERFFQNNQTTEVWAITLDEPSAGVVATSTVTFVATDSASGVVDVMIGGRKIVVPVTKADTGALLGPIFAALVNADLEMPCTASATLGVVTLSASHKGEYGNDIDVQVGYGGGSLPTGLAVTVAGFAGGTLSELLVPVWAAVGDEKFNIIASPFKEATQLGEIEDETERRWAPDTDAASLAFFGIDGTAVQALAFVASSNNGHIVPVCTYASPTPEWEYAAIFAALAGHYYKSAPAVPLKTLRCKGALPPLPNFRFTRAERQALLAGGVSTLDVDSSGRVVIERLVTTWTENSAGTADIAFRSPNTHATIDMRTYQQKARLQSRFSRVSLAENLTEFATSQTVATPKSIAAELVALYAEQIELGLVQNLANYTATLVVEIDAQDPSRVNVQESPHLVGQLHVIAIKNQFLL
jgi:phage tail sheath gpL-like